MLFDFGLDLFASWENWLKNRSITLFRNESDLNRYQELRLTRILKIHNSELGKRLNHIPKLRDLEPSQYLELFTSGTTSLRLEDRKYCYSLPQQPIMEDHHIWKIEQSHGMTEPGKVLYFSHSSEPFVSNGVHHLYGDHPITNDRFCSIFGPSQYLPVGGHNETYHFFYNVEKRFSQYIWDLNLERALALNPKFVRCSPSILEVVHQAAPNLKFNCPVILSEETLSERVREIANKMFTKAIDKMICWDGGMSWFECCHGRKHIYDEFCYLEEVDGRLVSTDLNNEAMPFIRYYNNDNGLIEKGMCSCGLYGNYFTKFFGKQVEAIYVDNRAVSGRFISEFLACFLRGGRFVNKLELNKNPFGNERMSYRIHQAEDQSIEFIYLMDEEMSDEQKTELVRVLSWILTSDEKRKLPISIRRSAASEFFHKETRRTKSLEISSAFLKTHREL